MTTAAGLAIVMLLGAVAWLGWCLILAERRITALRKDVRTLTEAFDAQRVIIHDSFDDRDRLRQQRDTVTAAYSALRDQGRREQDWATR